MLYPRIARNPEKAPTTYPLRRLRRIVPPQLLRLVDVLKANHALTPLMSFILTFRGMFAILPAIELDLLFDRDRVILFLILFLRRSRFAILVTLLLVSLFRLLLMKSLVHRPSVHSPLHPIGAVIGLLHLPILLPADLLANRHLLVLLLVPNPNLALVGPITSLVVAAVVEKVAVKASLWEARASTLARPATPLAEMLLRRGDPVVLFRGAWHASKDPRFTDPAIHETWFPVARPVLLGHTADRKRVSNLLQRTEAVNHGNCLAAIVIRAFSCR